LICMERLPGFRDFYPDPAPPQQPWSMDLRNHIFDQWRQTARRYGFHEYDGPTLEPLELYTTKSGDEIVAQLYNFIDKGDRPVSLRPEMTPTLARMVAQAERHYKKPIKWFAIPQLFRYERQQKGRLREHFQFNADIFGEIDPGADAELIALLIDSLRALGLTSADFVIRLSSRNAWQEFFSRHSSEQSRAYEFFQVIDKMEREEPAKTEEKLSALGFSLENVKSFLSRAEPTPELRSVLENLAARGLSDYVQIDYNVIRGLAYYTGIVFEAFDRKGELRAIAGGGRYDNLVKLVSGGKVDLPGLGFGMGDVVLAELLKARGLLPSNGSPQLIYVLIENEDLRLSSVRLVQQLRESGFSTDYPLVATKPDKQFKRALELKAAFTLRPLKKADDALNAIVKDLSSRMETELAADAVIPFLKKTRG
jgi:histidyl-tRNA synthetase